MKIVNEITSVRDESVDEDALYFNPIIYDYAKENNIPLYDLLRCLQSPEECYGYFGSNKGWTLFIVNKWFSLSPEGVGQELIRTGGRHYTDKYHYRVLLIMDIFGLGDDEAENYPDTGAGLPDNVLFNTLSKFDERKIKSPLDMRDVSLWDWKLLDNNSLEYDSDSDGWWFISPYIFGYAKSFERRNLLMNYNELPRGGK